MPIVFSQNKEDHDIPDIAQICPRADQALRARGVAVGAATVFCNMLEEKNRSLIGRNKSKSKSNSSIRNGGGVGWRGKSNINKSKNGLRVRVIAERTNNMVYAAGLEINTMRTENPDINFDQYYLEKLQSDAPLNYDKNIDAETPESLRLRWNEEETKQLYHKYMQGVRLGLLLESRCARK